MSMVQLETLSLTGYLEIAAAMAILQPIVLCAYALGAARARQFFHRSRSIRLMNRSAGVAMAGAAVVIATR